MRRILTKPDFAAWFTHYLSPAGLANVSRPPEVTDRTDYQMFTSMAFHAAGPGVPVESQTLFPLRIHAGRRCSVPPEI
jgi:hypothetical protein